MTRDRVSGPVWVICWRYPVVVETTEAMEVAELIRQGVDAVLVPLQNLEGLSDTFDIPEDRILRPAAWPGTQPARLSMVFSVLFGRPFGGMRVLRRLVTFAGDDARGALVTTVQLVRALAGRRTPQHIHAHFAGHLAHVAALVAEFFGCTWSTTAHARDIYTKPERLNADLHDAVFIRTISHHGQRWVTKHGGFETSGHIPIIHCGVDIEAIRPARGARPSDGAWRLVSVGRLIEKKGHDLLIGAIARLAAEGFTIECDIIGDGPELDRIQALVHDRGLDGAVRVLRGLLRERMLQTVADADVAVLASRTTEDGDREGIPLSLMEAMALGKPVVAGDVGGTRELVDGAGVLFDGQSVESLTQALRHVLTLEPAQFDAMARRCRSRVEQEFSLQGNMALLRERLSRVMSPAEPVGGEVRIGA